MLEATKVPYKKETSKPERGPEPDLMSFLQFALPLFIFLFCVYQVSTRGVGHGQEVRFPEGF